MRVTVLFVLCCLRHLTAVEVLEWDTLIDRYRDKAVPKGAVIYLGSAENHLPRMVRDGHVELHGLAMAVLDAKRPARNPISDRPIRGLEIFRLLGGNAGTLVFLDRDGVPLVQLSLPQIYHGNDAKVVSLFASYAAGGHHSTMSVNEYSRAMGLEEVERRADIRMQTNGFGLPLMPQDPVPTVVMDDGQPINLRDSPGVFFVIGFPDKPGFQQQLQEIALAFRAYGPRIVAVIPHDTTIPDRVHSVVGSLTVTRGRATLFRQEATPRIMLFGSDGSGMTFYGYQPADVLSKHTRVEVGNVTSRSPNMPYGETDTGTLPVVSPQEMVQRVERATAGQR